MKDTSCPLAHSWKLLCSDLLTLPLWFADTAPPMGYTTWGCWGSTFALEPDPCESFRNSLWATLASGSWYLWGLFNYVVPSLAQAACPDPRPLACSDWSTGPRLGWHPSRLIWHPSRLKASPHSLLILTFVLTTQQILLTLSHIILTSPPFIQSTRSTIHKVSNFHIHCSNLTEFIFHFLTKSQLITCVTEL